MLRGLQGAVRRVGRLAHVVLWSIAGLLVATVLANASDDNSVVRELQRKLWVLRELSGFKLDGEDSQAFRESLARFASKRNERFSDDYEAGALLDRAIAEKVRDAIGPYKDPLPFDRPSFSGDWVLSLVVAPDDNLVLAGSCENIVRFRLDTGMPLKNVNGAGWKFVFSATRDEIICSATWEDDQAGILIIDATTGLWKDFIVISGLTSHVAELAMTNDGETVWLFGDESVWSVSLATREVRRLARKLPEGSETSIQVSADGSIVAIEYFHMARREEDTPYEIRTYDVASGRQLIAKFGIQDLLLSPDGERFLATDGDKYHVRSSRTGKVLYSRAFTGDSPDDAVSFTSDGEALLFSADNENDRSLLRWDFAVDQVVRVVNFGLTGRYVKIDERHGKLYTIGSDGAFRYLLETGEALTQSRAINRTAIDAAAINPDATTAVAIIGSVAYVLDVGSGQVRELNLPGCTIDRDGRFVDKSPVAFSGASRVILGCDEGQLKELDLLTGEAVPIGIITDDRPEDVKVSRDGFYVAATYWHHVGDDLGHLLLVFERNSGRQVLKKSGPESFHAMGFIEGGRRLLYGTDHHAVVLDLATGKVVTRKELRLETTKSGKRTNWYWGSVGWVLPDAQGGDTALFGVTGLGGLVYEYEDGKFTLLEGKLMAGNHSVSLLAKSGRVSRNPGGVLSLRGQRPAIGTAGGSRYSSTHDSAGGDALAIGSQEDGRFVVVTDVGGILLYDSKRSAPIVTTILSDKGNWLSRIDGGFFAGTRGAGENLFLAPSFDESITIDSLFDALYRPDLVAAVAAGTQPGEDQAQAEGSIAALLKDGLPPTVAITAPTGNVVSDKESITASATVTPSTGGIGRIEWRVNGIVRVARSLAPGVKVTQGETLVIEDDLILEPGDNVVEFVVFNASNGIASEPASQSVVWGASGVSGAPRLFLLAIGINRYWDSRLNLKFAANDATEITRSFKLAGSDLFDDVKTWMVTDEQATREGIGLAFDEISRSIRSTDVFVLFVAGHGKTEDGRYYFLPYDFRYSGTTSIAEQGVNQDHWQGWMARVATRKSLLMFDTCESGTLTMEHSTRGFDRLAALERLTRATGRSVLAASSDEGPALEGFQGHGVFAYTILEGLGAADPNRTGLVQVTALASYVGARVPELSFGKFGIRQVPQMKLIGEDFTVGKTVSALTNPAADFIPTQPTHVVLSATKVTDRQGNPTAELLSPGTLLRVVTVADTHSEVARGGKLLGYVPSSSLAPMQ